VPGYTPARRTPCLDFLAEVEGLADTPGYNDILTGDQQRAIADAVRGRDEEAARLQLLRMRGALMTRAFLDEDQQRRLADVLDDRPVGFTSSRARRQLRLPSINWNRRTITVFAILVALLLGGGIVGAIAASIHNSPAPPASSQPLPPVPPQPMPITGLQQTMKLFGPWVTIAPSQQVPSTHNPDVLMLHADGSTEASLKWTIPAPAADWTPTDPSVIASNLSVNGNQVDLMSSTQRPYVVAVNQPFILDSDPGHVYRVDDTGTVYVITLAQATADRLPVKSH
jgi:hypothetical protein